MDELTARRERRERRRRKEIREEQQEAFLQLWDEVFWFSGFAAEFLSPRYQEYFKLENEELKRAADRWLDKLYSMPPELKGLSCFQGGKRK
jgi:hypothetical protein